MLTRASGAYKQLLPLRSEQSVEQTFHPVLPASCTQKHTGLQISKTTLIWSFVWWYCVLQPGCVACSESASTAAAAYPVHDMCCIVLGIGP